VDGNADDATIVEGRGEMLDPLIVGVEMIGKTEGLLAVVMVDKLLVEIVVGYIVGLTVGQANPAGDGR